MYTKDVAGIHVHQYGAHIFHTNNKQMWDYAAANETPATTVLYPVNDAKNGTLYTQYKAPADAEIKIIFGGRLGEYKYYDMDQVIAEALKKWEQIM